MFTETDEIFVWAKKGRKNKVYKLKTSASVRSEEHTSELLSP